MPSNCAIPLVSLTIISWIIYHILIVFTDWKREGICNIMHYQVGSIYEHFCKKYNIYGWLSPWLAYSELVLLKVMRITSAGTTTGYKYPCMIYIKCIWHHSSFTLKGNIASGFKRYPKLYLILKKWNLFKHKIWMFFTIWLYKFFTLLQKWFSL